MKTIHFFTILVVIMIAPTVTTFAGGQKDGSVTPEPIEVSPTEVEVTEKTSEASVQSSHVSFEDIAVLLQANGITPASQPTEAPDFILTTLQGEQKALSDYQGKTVFLNFWATWCPPCRAEMPSMEAVYGKLKNSNFEIVAVNLREDEQTVQKFIDQYGYSYPILLDKSGEIGGGYAVRGIPTTYLIDKTGFIMGRLVGTREWDTPEILDLFAALDSYAQ